MSPALAEPCPENLTIMDWQFQMRFGNLQNFTGKRKQGTSLSMKLNCLGTQLI